MCVPYSCWAIWLWGLKPTPTHGQAATTNMLQLPSHADIAADGCPCYWNRMQHAGCVVAGLSVCCWLPCRSREGTSGRLPMRLTFGHDSRAFVILVHPQVVGMRLWVVVAARGCAPGLGFVRARWLLCGLVVVRRHTTHPQTANHHNTTQQQPASANQHKGSGPPNMQPVAFALLWVLTALPHAWSIVLWHLQGCNDTGPEGRQVPKHEATHG